MRIVRICIYTVKSLKTTDIRCIPHKTRLDTKEGSKLILQGCLPGRGYGLILVSYKTGDNKKPIIAMINPPWRQRFVSVNQLVGYKNCRMRFARISNNPRIGRRPFLWASHSDKKSKLLDIMICLPDQMLVRKGFFHSAAIAKIGQGTGQEVFHWLWRRLLHALFAARLPPREKVKSNFPRRTVTEHWYIDMIQRVPS